MLQRLYLWLLKLYNRVFENNVFRRVVKNSGYLTGTTGISAALGMVQGILIARLLGVNDYGVLGAIITFISILNKLVSFRMGELVVQYVGHFTETGDEPRAAAVYKIATIVEIVTSFIAYGLVYLLSPFGAQFLAKDPNASDLFAFYGLIVLINMVVESSTGLLQIFDRFSKMAGWNLAASISTLALVLMVYLLDGTLTGILLAYMIGKTINALGISLAAQAEAVKRWGKSWWKTPISLLHSQRRELTNFAISTNISASLSLITKDSEVLWVSFFRGPTEAGYYRLALSLANIVQLPISPLPQATYPELSRQVARLKWDNFRYILRQGSYLAGGYSLAATIFLIAFGNPLIAVIYSPEYLPAYAALVILLVGLLVANTFYWRRPALLTLGLPDFPTKVNSILAAAKVIGILLLVPSYGYMASAALLTGFYWIGSIVNVLKIRSVLTQRTQVSST